MLKMILMDKFKNWMAESANILFDDSKNANFIGFKFYLDNCF